MRFFDYTYYRIFKFYQGFNESGPWAFGIPSIAMSQYFVLLSMDRVILLTGITDSYYFEGNREYVIMGLIFGFNFCRYYWLVPYSKLKARWQNETKAQKSTRGVLILIYLLGSLGSALYLTGFFHSR